ncbi:class Ib ribonucleoside-diphosphate reductase assembly flavoprotein NrdI [Paenibacillus sp. N1-5-1-14]|uniref:class Ib ribonucleoside-diphosphate reductase assembly flavoprotein NrdI n=1 Tax=Paenibacillus radicibacter TaxID=2972488 RepID=UPI002158A751|nr:class Ib ribonucleoside-diphosphate reductase assembly flavoprotein NrdI [Paenibacillus radicibacter]MCR8641197.1 class Ib ribonucleoside-diphosphate reductase assembly flavoprotein NrdI [Paenibacillus radicibacter]
MLIAYDSKTGNVKRFVNKLDPATVVQVSPELDMDEPFILVTYTTGFGQAPQSTMDFLDTNGHWLRGVASSGNMNWGTRYGLAGDHISAKYDVPLLMKFELSGTSKDVERFKWEVNQIVHANTEVDSA